MINKALREIIRADLVNSTTTWQQYADEVWDDWDINFYSCPRVMTYLEFRSMVREEAKEIEDARRETERERNRQKETQARRVSGKAN